MPLRFDDGALFAVGCSAYANEPATEGELLTRLWIQIQVENFPTIRVTRGDAVLFHGTLLPMHEHLRKLLEKLLVENP